MSSDLNNGFEKLIRDKLEDYRTSVAPDSWNVIEKSLRRSRKLKYLYTATGIVAAAAVVLLITFNFPNNDNLQNDKPTTVVSQGTASAPTQPDSQNDASGIDGQSPQKTIEPKQQTADSQTKQNQYVANPVFVAAASNTIAAQDGQSDNTSPEDPPIKNRLIIVPQSVSGTSISLSSTNKLQLPNNMRPTVSLNNERVDKKNDKQISADKKDIIANLDKNNPDNKKWSVSMGFGAGNYQTPSVNNKNSDLIMAAPLLTSSNSANYIRNKYRDETKVPDNADVQHGLPLSAKFIVRRDFNSRWAIESGVNYTYLSTKYKWNKNTVNQQLHYIGIPLNAVCYVVSKPSWNIYASAGGMVEKGVYAHINRSDNLAVDVKMKGLQWSVNGAIGATYKLGKGLGVFVEPQFGYFFDNGQPESIRTEWPVSFGLGAGLRFNF